MTTSAATTQLSPPGSLLDAFLLQAGYNSAVVMLGCAALGIAGGVVGVFAMLRGRSLIGDAIAHSMLPGICIAFLAGGWLGANARAMPLLMAGAAFTGLLGAATVKLLRHIPRFTEDLAMAVVLSVFFGFGAVLLNLIVNTGYGNSAGLSHLLLGQAAAMLTRDAWIIAILALTCVAVCGLLFKELRLLCFDDRFAKATGLATNALDTVLLAMILLVTLIGLQAVGLVLVVAMLIIPAASARFWTNQLAHMCLLALTFGGASGYIGSGLSRVLVNVPTGATIVLTCGMIFLISAIASPQRGLLGALLRRAAMHSKIRTDHALRHAYERRHLQDESVTGETGEFYPIGRISRMTAWRMRARGLLTRSPHGLSLTPAGIREAKRLTTTHELWEQYLEIYAGLGAERVHDPADLVEHVMTPALSEALEKRVREAGESREPR